MLEKNKKKGLLTVPSSGKSLNLADPSKLLSTPDKERLDRSLEEMARSRRQAEASSQNIRLS
jgi:hypothetical protein